MAEYYWEDYWFLSSFWWMNVEAVNDEDLKDDRLEIKFKDGYPISEV